MYIIFLSLAYLFHFYFTGCNFTFFPVSCLMEASLFICFSGGLLVWFARKTKKEKVLFSMFILACCFMFFIPFAGWVRLQFFGNLRHNLPVLYSYRWIIASCVLCSMLCFFFKILRAISFSANFQKSLNFFAIILFLLIIYNSSKNYKNKDLLLKNNGWFSRIDKNKHPNIYHICLDSYSSCHYLSEAYGFDNTFFYKQLNDLGFWCDMDAKSNYSNTISSFCSSFEMSYFDGDKYDEYDLQMRIYFNNKAIKTLKKKGGYQCYINSPTVPTLESIDFDFRNKRSRLSFYYYLFLRTPLEFFLFQPFQKQHYNDILMQFDQMVSVKEVYGESGNYFLFHVLCPHEPFIFTPYGEMNQHLNSYVRSMFKSSNDTENKMVEYVDQIKYLNVLTLKVVKQILESYDENNKPIIIIHGDHGLSVQPLSRIDNWRVNNLTPMDRCMLSILYAVYWPKSLGVPPPPDGLVNLFRWLLNSLFQEKMDYLPSKQTMRIDNYFIPNINV